MCILFGKEVGFEVGSDSKVGFLFPTYIFLLINHYMSVSDEGIRRAVKLIRIVALANMPTLPPLYAHIALNLKVFYISR